ncbi:MAG TPA: FAD-dependent oxidoreductase [Chitinophaga sp.]|uniref:flavin monoamine oxidase family protein n=1 Tax=Chitinophaga sp. TaxID=1869181 RepID=UPI002C6FA23C|nr:FAD-dependent oxidoreductase [Chitinophaga sp.]HVI47227.1 FAD-dependent oxidoreductase [Chitinophaga sp.]
MAMNNIDIAIIGGGVSGVYSGWKLKEKYGDTKSIRLFEGSDHIGGRLLSVRPPAIDNMVAELGGMRILENVQPLITKLIPVLNKKLPPEEQIELFDFPVDEPQNIAYLRGIYLRLADFTLDPAKVPYKFSKDEYGKGPGTIIVDAIEKIVPGITEAPDEKRREMVKKATFEGVPLYQWGFWNILYKVISSEGYQFSLDAGGYDSTLVNWNAADAIPWFLSDFGISPEYKGFTNGFQQVPITLGKLFESLGGIISLNAKLRSFEWKDGHFELKFDNEVITAKELILAMPRRSLDLLTPYSPKLQEIHSLIASVTGRPLFKLFTTYDSPWWRNISKTKDPVPLQEGRSVTDIPVRQTYYWPKDDGKPVTEGKAMLLASYDDGNNTGFWDGLRPQRGLAWKLGRAKLLTLIDVFRGADDELDGAAGLSANGLNQEWGQYAAPKRMVEELSRQLSQMHNIATTPEVKAAAFRDWGEDPYGGGWNSWNIGVKSWEVRDKIVHPLPDCPLFICGEAYSDAQGWVEGALQTADIMLEKFVLQAANAALESI